MARWGLVPARAHGHRNRAARIHVAASGLGAGSAADVWQRSRRCIFPMLGFYAWQAGAPALPWFISLTGHELFGVAGIWDERADAGSNLHFLSAAMITLPMRPPVLPEPRPGGRMPSVLAADDYDIWLGADPHTATELLRPLPASEWRAWRVGPQVADLNNKGPACMEPLAA
jgi:putative SOS response-associated peptidase YedK